MKLSITDTTESNPGNTGDVSLEVVNNGKIDLAVDISPESLSEVFPSIEAPEDVAEFFEESAAGARAMQEAMEDLNSDG